MALRPIRLDVDSLVGILEGLLVFGLGGIDRGTVRIEDVVFGLETNGLGKFLTWFSLAS